MQQIIEVSDTAFENAAPAAKSDEAQAEQKEPENKAKKEEEKKSGPSLQWLFRDHLAASDYLAVVKDPITDARATFRWDRGHWAFFRPNSRTEYAEAFCAKSKGGYGAQVWKQCAESITPALVNHGRVLKHLVGRHIIATPGAQLEITPKGITVSPHDRSLFVPLFVDVAIDQKRVQVDPDPCAQGKDLKSYLRLRTTGELEEGTLWGHLMIGLFPDRDMREAVQDFLGDVLTQIPSQTVAVLQGEAGLGKSVVLNVLADLVGGSQTINLSRATPYQLAELHMCPLVTVDEIRGRIDGTLLKQLTGRSRIQAERKYEQPFTFQCTAKMIMAWNTAPRLSEDSSAFEQRLVLFTTGGVGHRGAQTEIVDLKEQILAKESDVVFEWLLQGALRVVKRGRLPSRGELPWQVQADRKRLAVESDPMLGFVKELEITPSTSVSEAYDTDDVYKLLCEWLKREGRQPLAPMSKNTAIRNLRRVLEREHGVGSTGQDLRVSISAGPGKKKRVRVLRLSFGQPVTIQALQSRDVETSERDPDAYDFAPKEVIEAAQRRAEYESLPAQERRARDAQQLIADGFVIRDGVWQKAIGKLDRESIDAPF